MQMGHLASAMSARKTTFEQEKKMARSIMRVAEAGCMISVLRTKTNASVEAEIYY
jgi:hypothetical protein